MTGQKFPAGKFSYHVGEYSPIVDIFEDGKITLTLSGEIIVIAKYQVMGETIEVSDVEGSYASPEYGIGKYLWYFAGNILSFTLIEDKNPARQKSFAVPWSRVQ